MSASDLAIGAAIGVGSVVAVLLIELAIGAITSRRRRGRAPEPVVHGRRGDQAKPALTGTGVVPKPRRSR